MRSNYGSPEYFFNNFCSPVLFHEINKHMPEHGIIIEVASHGILQSTLKRSLPENVTCISLLNKDSKDGEQLFLSNIGR